MSDLPADFPVICGPETIAELLMVSPETIRRYIRLGGSAVPPSFTVGTGPRARVRFRRADVEAWLQSRIRQAA